ncbi:MAG: hypothetical protein HOE62_07380 [Alphaproteobacteria bacterium]|jgi:hypothetical protein|nr:hypothetical protein [Alphaproteobacteria bacterium]MBT4017757.1 hypothetical protein [Alphaproteobacteria bacterium]MBT4964723.1 hypothetical protein [Alphaproteobacteria bacterium]
MFTLLADNDITTLIIYCETEKGGDMQRQLTRVIIVAGALALVTACVSKEVTWYEQRCQQIGLSKGTADFDKCVARDEAWIDADRKRAGSTKMR